MYEDMIKRLKETSEDFGELDSVSVMLLEAADAIEELNAEKAKIENSGKLLAAAFERLKEKVPKWISVEEQLPEQRINQNTLDFEYVLCVTTFGDVRPYKYGRRIGQGTAHFWNGAGYVDAYITHWMPLPKLPEEENHV